MNFAKEHAKLSRFVSTVHVSTLDEWYKACQSTLTHNRASVEIDMGKEPYVVDLDADEMGMYPYIPCMDIMADKRGLKADLIGVDFVNGTKLLESDILIFWR